MRLPHFPLHTVLFPHLPLIGEYVFGTGVLFFPLSYLFGDILTEVYGYARARRCIWAGTAALLAATQATFRSVASRDLDEALRLHGYDLNAKERDLVGRFRAALEDVAAAF